MQFSTPIYEEEGSTPCPNDIFGPGKCHLPAFDCPWLIWVHFRGPWLRSQQFWIGFAVPGAFLAIFWPAMNHTANSVKKIRSKMASTGVPHIVQHVLCSMFRPSKVSIGRFGQLSFKGKKTFANKKGYFPQQNWLKLCVWTPKHLPDLGPKAIFGTTNIFKARIGMRNSMVLLRRGRLYLFPHIEFFQHDQSMIFSANPWKLKKCFTRVATPSTTESPMYPVGTPKEREILEAHLQTRSYIKG